MPKAVVGIVAADPNLAIGRDNRIPWRFPEDMRFFRETTTGHAVVMGRRTHESLGRALPGRINLVLSRDPAYRPAEGAHLTADVQDAIRATPEDRNLFVIGGAEIYALFSPVIDRWLVTRIPTVVTDADAHMSPDFLDGYRVVDTVALTEELRVEVLERADRI